MRSWRLVYLIPYALIGAVLYLLAKIGGARFEDRVSWWIFRL